MIIFRIWVGWKTFTMICGKVCRANAVLLFAVKARDGTDKEVLVNTFVGENITTDTVVESFNVEFVDVFG